MLSCLRLSFKSLILKKDIGKFLPDGMKPETAVELRDLEMQVAAINRKYSNGVLSVYNVKGLKKVEIFTYLDKKQDEINKLIESSNVSTIYKIINLSTEYVSPIVKKNLDKLAAAKVVEAFNEDDLDANIYGDREVIMSRWRRRYLKAAKISKRKKILDRYNEEGNGFVMPKKL